MNRRTIRTLVLSTLRSVRYLVSADVRFPNDRLGYVLELPDGDRYLVYRETTRRSAPGDGSDDRAVLVFRMRITRGTVGRRLRDVLVDPLANVATPFFVGMPGFRRKLWLAGERPGEFLELYEWAAAADAERFVDVLQSLLAPFDAAGDASFEVVEDDTVDEYVASRSIEWRDATARRPWRATQRRSVGRVRLALAVFLALLALLASYRRWTRGRRRTQ